MKNGKRHEKKLVAAVSSAIGEVTADLARAGSMISKAAAKSTQRVSSRRSARAKKVLGRADKLLHNCIVKLMPFRLELTEAKNGLDREGRRSRAQKSSLLKTPAGDVVADVARSKPLSTDLERFFETELSALRDAVGASSSKLYACQLRLSRCSEKDLSEELAKTLTAVGAETVVIHGCRCAIAREIKIQDWTIIEIESGKIRSSRPIFKSVKDVA